MENKFVKSEHDISSQEETSSTDPQMQSLSSFNDEQIMKILEEINDRLKKIEEHLSISWVHQEARASYDELINTRQAILYDQVPGVLLFFSIS